MIKFDDTDFSIDYFKYFSEPSSASDVRSYLIKESTDSIVEGKINNVGGHSVTLYQISTGVRTIKAVIPSYQSAVESLPQFFNGTEVLIPHMATNTTPTLHLYRLNEADLSLVTHSMTVLP